MGLSKARMKGINNKKKDSYSSSTSKNGKKHKKGKNKKHCPDSPLDSIEVENDDSFSFEIEVDSLYKGDNSKLETHTRQEEIKDGSYDVQAENVLLQEAANRRNVEKKTQNEEELQEVSSTDSSNGKTKIAPSVEVPKLPSEVQKSGEEEAPKLPAELQKIDLKRKEKMRKETKMSTSLLQNDREMNENSNLNQERKAPIELCHIDKSKPTLPSRKENPAGSTPVTKKSEVAQLQTSEAEFRLLQNRAPISTTDPLDENGNSSNPNNSSLVKPWTSLFHSNRKIENCVKLKHLPTEKNGIVKLQVSNIKQDDELANCLVGCIIGRFTGRHAIYDLAKTWKMKVNIEFHDSGWIIFKFANGQELESVLKRGPYYIYGRSLVLKKLPPFFTFGEMKMTTVPIWVKFPNLPLELWKEEYLSPICSEIGKPLMIDQLTSQRTTWNYARALIEIDLEEDQKDTIELHLDNGVSFVQKVIYEKKPPYCRKCSQIGHNTTTCRINTQMDEKEVLLPVLEPRIKPMAPQDKKHIQQEQGKWRTQKSKKTLQLERKEMTLKKNYDSTKLWKQKKNAHEGQEDAKHEVQKETEAKEFSLQPQGKNLEHANQLTHTLSGSDYEQMLEKWYMPLTAPDLATKNEVCCSPQNQIAFISSTSQANSVYKEYHVNRIEELCKQGMLSKPNKNGNGRLDSVADKDKSSTPIT